MFSAQQNRSQLILPSLSSISLESKELSVFLANVMTPEKSNSERHFGPFLTTSDTHRLIWDDFLAKDPDKASCIRGLASQRRFLEAPDMELNLNWGYAVAISATLIEMKADTALKSLRISDIEQIWFDHYSLCEHACYVKSSYLKRKNESDQRSHAA